MHRLWPHLLIQTLQMRPRGQQPSSQVILHWLKFEKHNPAVS